MKLEQSLRNAQQSQPNLITKRSNLTRRKREITKKQHHQQQHQLQQQQQKQTDKNVGRSKEVKTEKAEPIARTMASSGKFVKESDNLKRNKKQRQRQNQVKKESENTFLKKNSRKDIIEEES